jgi:hypothetical protein
MEDLRAFLERHRAPDLEALLGGVDRGVRLVDAPTGDLRDGLFVDRREVGECRAGGDALAADPVVGRDLDVLDLDAPAQCRPPRYSFVPERYGRPASLVKPSSASLGTP